MTDAADSIRQGAVIRVDDIDPATGLRGHPGCTAYRMLTPPGGLSRWLHLTYDDFEPGGGIDPHYHEGLEADHAYYVVEGEVRARIGEEFFDVGPRSLMVFPCDEVHGFTVGPEGAVVLRLGAAPDGRASGGSVFVDADGDRS